MSGIRNTGTVSANGLSIVSTLTDNIYWFTADITLTNLTGTALSAWQVGFDVASAPTSLWGGHVTTHTGTHYVVADDGWNAPVPAGGSVTFHFNGNGPGPSLPTGFSVNGTTLLGAAPSPAPAPAPAPTPVPTPVPTPAPTPAPVPVPVPVPASTPNLSASMSVTADWGSGWNGLVTLSNAGGTITGWTISFDLPNTITAIWDGTILSHTGTRYTVSNVSWDATLATGRPVTFGFNVAGARPTLPTNFVINGASTGTALPSISVSGTTVNEGVAGSHDAVFLIALSGPAIQPVTVAYTTVASTAAAGIDFAAASGRITIPTGTSTASVSIPTFPGSPGTHEVRLVLSDPTGAAIATGTASATLITPTPTPTPIPAPTPALLLANQIVDLTPPQGGAAGSRLAGGYLHTNGNQIIDATGKSVRIAAVNWFGLDNPNMAPGGLDTQSYRAIMDRMVQAGFNTIRLPFSNALLHSPIAPPSINATLNPDLAGLKGLALMDKIVAYAGQIGLKIILDDHNSDGGSGPNTNGLWYDATHTDAAFTADWKMLAQHYAGNATVIGADLFNEPHSTVDNGRLNGATWGATGGDGTASDWAAAATRTGNAIQSVNPNWLIVVEGVQVYQNSFTGWGANLMGVKDHPVTLSVPNQVVYSAHDYPATIYPFPWLTDPAFPANLPAVWTQQWGFIARQNIAPVFIGEYGSNLTTPGDHLWAKALTGYLSTQAGTAATPGQQGISSAYFAWNATPGSALTGLVQPDYATANVPQQTAAQQLAYHTTDRPASVDFSIALAAPATMPITIAYRTADGTAHAGTDYVATAGTVTFAPGETARIVPALLLNPGTSGNLTFMLNLSTTTGQALGSESATILHDPQAAISRTSQQWSNIAYNTVTITNTSSTTINGWQVAVDTAAKVTDQVYDAQLTSHSDTHYLFTSAAWNQKIAPGAQVSFSFGATQTSINTPVSVSMVHTGQ